MHLRNHSEPVTPRTGNRIPRPPAVRIVWLQLLLGLLASMTALALGDRTAMASALAGTAVAVLPNLVFVWIVFRHRGARAARRVIGDLYLAEAGKFLLTVCLFAAVFAWLRPLAAGWVFAAYMAALSAYWFGPWLLAGPVQEKKTACEQAS